MLAKLKKKRLGLIKSEPRAAETSSSQSSDESQENAANSVLTANAGRW